MGLDTVEFVMEIEEEFSITISDEDAAELGIVGDLAEYVYRRIKGTDKEGMYAEVLGRIIEMLEENYGIRKGTANATSHVVNDLGLD